MSLQKPTIDFTAELERQAGEYEGREEDWQKTLSGTSEGDGLTFGGYKGLSSAGVSATAKLQGVTSRIDWYLDRVVHFKRSGTLTVNHDVVGAASDLNSYCFMRYLQSCCHPRSPFAALTQAFATVWRINQPFRTLFGPYQPKSPLTAESLCVNRPVVTVYCAVHPPSIESAAPVIVSASLLQRNTAIAPMDSGVVNLDIGCFSASNRSISNTISVPDCCARSSN